jgi:2-dehydro-3-deoxyphosphogluconate aldolase/(4S)-4-hydroxy-2-oxoglutarate aldolase
MGKQEVIERIRKARVIPVVRTSAVERAVEVCEALLAGRMPVLEITMTVPGAVDVIRHFASSAEAPLVGAGTVLDAETARECAEAGAAFIVTPSFVPEVMRFCDEEDIFVIAGALTPTEVLNAHRAGADAVKVFPVTAVGGSRYLSVLKPVFPQIEMIPTGGIKLEDAAGIIEAGALAVGIGDRLTSGTPEEIVAACEELRERLGIAHSAS